MRSSRCSEICAKQGLTPRLAALLTSAPRGARRAGPSRASRYALRLILLDRWNHFLPQQFQTAHRGSMRHGSLACPQHQPGWLYHVEYGLEPLDDRIRRPSDHLLHLLCLLIANIAKGVAQRRLLVAGSSAAHIASGALPVQGRTPKGAPELPVKVSALLIGLDIGVGHADAYGVAIVLFGSLIPLCSRR